MDMQEKIRTLPTRPGVYLYKNADGEVIYVGKAKNLRSRVRSYLLEASQANAKTGSLMRDAVDVDYILVDNEHEALALENNLIKQRKPRFNILLRDDKTYPYVKLTLADRYPKVFVTRRLRRDGSAYYGPYFPGNLAYRVVDLIHRSFCCPAARWTSHAIIRVPACSTTSDAASDPALKTSRRRRFMPKPCAMRKCSWKAAPVT